MDKNGQVKRGFVMTMVNGDVARVVVSCEPHDDGEMMANVLTQAALEERMWDICTHPVTEDMRVGLTLLSQEKTIIPDENDRKH